jgi:hypothetical protein
MIGMALEPPRSGDMVTVHEAILNGRWLAIAKRGTEQPVTNSAPAAGRALSDTALHQHAHMPELAKRVARAMLHVGKNCESTAFSAAGT